MKRYIKRDMLEPRSLDAAYMGSLMLYRLLPFG